MSKFSTVAFSESAPAGHPHDLLARLYREIGISAVAAALDVMGKPDAPEAPASNHEEPAAEALRETRAA